MADTITTSKYYTRVHNYMEAIKILSSSITKTEKDTLVYYLSQYKLGKATKMTSTSSNSKSYQTIVRHFNAMVDNYSSLTAEDKQVLINGDDTRNAQSYTDYLNLIISSPSISQTDVNKSNTTSVLERGSNVSINAATQVVTSSKSMRDSGIAKYTNRTNLGTYLNSTTGYGANFTASDLEQYLNGIDINTAKMNDVANGSAIISSNYSAIEGMPYQFHKDVDRRVGDMTLGRKYVQKMYARMPLLFITPCRAKFMDGFSSQDKSTIASLFLDPGDKFDSSVIEGQGKFYTPQFAYSEYYDYLNLMLNAVARFLDLGSTSIKIGKGRSVKLGSATWNNELSDEFKRFWSSQENLVFYVDNFTEVSQSLSNTYGESQLAATINGFADTANEIKFLFGTEGNAIANALGGSKEMLSSVTSSIGQALGSLGGGVVGSLASSGINTIMNGGKIIFPQIWQDSSMEESYSFNFKFRSPDHDTLSIYMNVLKPYCKLLCLAMAQQDEYYSNGYNTPFIVKAYCKGKVNIDVGGITSMSVTKGAECQWNDDGLPTQIDVSLEVQNLYSHLAMTPYQSLGKFVSAINNNTAYMDFLANMAGLNIGKMEIGRRTLMKTYLGSNSIKNLPSRLGTKFDQGISNLIGSLYNLGI